MYGLIGKMIMKAGRRDALIALLLEGVAEMPGCLSYVVGKDSADADAIWITEVWDSEASHDASLSLPSVRDRVARARPMIAGFGASVVTTPMGGYGLAAPERDTADHPTVTQMRIVVEAEDYDDAVHFYRDVLGLPEQAAFAGEGDARVAILDAGRATLEIANPAQKRMIDEVEVGRQVAPQIRLAFEVADTAGATRDLVSAGAQLIAAPRETPWRSLNSRLLAPAGLQITLFQELGTSGSRS